MSSSDELVGMALNNPPPVDEVVRGIRRWVGNPVGGAHWRNRVRLRSVEPVPAASQADTDAAVAAFLARGGAVTRCPDAFAPGVAPSLPLSGYRPASDGIVAPRPHAE